MESGDIEGVAAVDYTGAGAGRPFVSAGCQSKIAALWGGIFENPSSLE
jgi:hypothetical protein